VPYRPTERTAARSAETRRRIVAAARGLIAEGGYAEAQVSAVASRARVATGTVYRHFPSKGELFAQALALNAQHEVDVIAAVAAADGAAASRLADALRVFARRAVQARRLAWAMIAEPAEAEVDAARIVYRRAFADVFEKVIRDGIAAGEFPSQHAAASAACVIGALAEGLIGPLAPEAPDLPNTRALIDSITVFCLQAVSAAPYRSLRLVESKP
jgi:AcrR family transcriptional regulator